MYTSLAPTCLGNIWGRRKRRGEGREGRGGRGAICVDDGGHQMWPATASLAGGEAVVHLMGHVLLGTGGRCRGNTATNYMP